MSHIRIEDLKALCKQALTQEGMSQENAQIVAETLAQTDALGTHSHGTKNLHGYILKARAGGVSLTAEPEVVMQSESCAVIDAKNTLGMIPSAKAVEIACEKAAKTGIAMTAVYHSCHFGAAGYYANLAAQKNMIGIAVSNVDANMNVPGARGRVMGNNPFAYAAPAKHTPSVFLDIALSNVASLKVVQAKKDGRRIPDTWIVDADGLPTTDPSIYPEHGAMQPMAAHKGHGGAADKRSSFAGDLHERADPVVVLQACRAEQRLPQLYRHRPRPLRKPSVRAGRRGHGAAAARRGAGEERQPDLYAGRDRVGSLHADADRRRGAAGGCGAVAARACRGLRADDAGALLILSQILKK